MDSAVCREPPPPRQLISLQEEFALPQHKFNTSAVLTSLRGRLGQVSLHDHHFLPVLKILTLHPPNSDFSRLDNEKPPEASWSSFLPPLWGLCCKASIRSGPVSSSLTSLARSYEAGTWKPGDRIPETGSSDACSCRLELSLGGPSSWKRWSWGCRRDTRRVDKSRHAPQSPRRSATAPRPARGVPPTPRSHPRSREAAAAGGIEAGA